MSNKENNPANFANLPKETVREIASEGGKASHGGASHSTTDDSAGETHNTNPGNFANRPKEEVKEAGHKGGLASHKDPHSGGSDGDNEGVEPSSGSKNTNPGNFANRPEEEVKEAAHKGGLASHKNDGK